MSHKIELLKADIKEELTKLKKLEEEFRTVETKLNLPPEEVSNYDRAAIGYYLHNFYNGCENIFLAVARFFENDLARNSWHTNVLKRMQVEIQGIRPALIDEVLFRLLDDFRGFRYKFRHCYTFELDWERERLVGKKFSRTFQLLHDCIEDFFTKLDQLEQ